MSPCRIKPDDDQPCPPDDSEYGGNRLPPREDEPQPGPPSDRDDRMPRHGDLLHLGWTVNHGKKRAS